MRYPMPAKDTPPRAESVSIPPKRRWFRRLLVTLVLLVGLVVAAHWGAGRVMERKLNRQVALLRAAGEPMLPAEVARLDADSVPDADNAALILRTAAASVDEQT